MKNHVKNLGDGKAGRNLMRNSEKIETLEEKVLYRDMMKNHSKKSVM